MAIGIVNTKYGKLRGVEYDGKYSDITVFRGIPYAAPPVGELRWKAPQDPATWDGVRDCDKFGPAPIQTVLNDRHAKEYYFSSTPELSEDCLYLNICTGAQSNEERRPVYIWFHGGGLTNCYAYEEQFNPQELAKKGVVVVTVGQRLSLFGYLALPQLSREQGGKSGNYGFMDQLKALEWVYENIARFGGDPERITAGGQSGGCTKAAALAVSPASNGRVKRVISQSGLKMMSKFVSLDFAEKEGVDYLRYAGIDPETPLDELRKMDTYELYKDAPRAIMPGNMVYDAELVPFVSLKDAIERYGADIDFMSGSNLGEADVFAKSVATLGRYNVKEYTKGIRNNADFHAHFRNLLGPLYDKYNCDKLLSPDDASAYRAARHLAGLGLAGWEGMNFSRNLMLNRMFGVRRKKLGHGGKTYSYYWTHIEPCRPEDYGTDRDPDSLLAWHSSELWYVFNSLREGVPPLRPWEPLDFEIGERMSSYWANFIATGDPNGDGLNHWPESGDNFGWMELGDEAIAHQWDDSDLEKLIRDFVIAEYGYGSELF